ncbi:MAG: alpha/beta fold hydrolase [Paludibacteraceae bacterium]
MTMNDNDHTTTVGARSEFLLDATADNLKISVLTTTPNAIVVPKAIVQIVHGMCEHKERYLPFMQFLNTCGYVCIIHDHRGHGKSLRSTDDLGYFYDGGYKAMIHDTHAVTTWAKQHFPDLPLYLFGHSMGSMVVRSYTKRYDNELAGLIVCGSPSYNAGSIAGRGVAKLLSLLRGSHHRSAFIQKLAFGNYNKHFGPAQSPNAWICSDPEIVTWYDANPLCNFTFTTNGFYNLFALMRDAYSSKHWAMARPQLPVMFVSGADDPCLISQEKFDQAVSLMRQVGYDNVDSKLYIGMRHEILNEKGKEQVWRDIADTLDTWQNANKQ